MPRSTPWRPQPPSIRDPRDGQRTADAPERFFDGSLPPTLSGDQPEKGQGGRLWSPGVDTEPPPGINWNDGGEATRLRSRGGEEPEVEEEDDGYEEAEPDWDNRARDALENSTTYADQNYRKQWDDSLRAFNNQHPADSKYNTETYRKRSNLYVPKVRSVIRKNEAATAAAFFSNIDRVSITGMNQGDVRQRISADLNQQLLQYRLTKSIPWFQVVLGGCQDAQVMGACVWNPHWKYVTRRDPKTRELKLVKDEPACPLVPLENFRFDPSANWMDVVNTSPYLIELIPMYWCDVKDRMERPDPKGRVWMRVEALDAVGPQDGDDSTRAARVAPRIDPAKQQRTVGDYDVCWIHRHIHRWAGADYEWYTIRSEFRLTDPEPLANTEFHGERPYVMGLWVLEAHKALPSSLPTLVKPLADEAMEIKNSRLDAVKFAINPGFFAKRGRNVDLPALVRNVPGRIVLMDDTEKDARPIERQDVTQSAYLEEDRNSQAFDDLVGNFNPMAMQQQRTPRESQGTVRMLQSGANALTEYAILTFNETGILPLVRKLVLLEQHYETDKVILAIAGQKAKAYQKYGLDEITDNLLDAEVTVAVNLGMGATDPVLKMQRFIQGQIAFANIAKAPPPGVNLEEVYKEICALTGYQDGERFSIGQNPELVKLQQQNMALMKKLQMLEIDKRNKHESNVVKLRLGRENNIIKAMLADKEDRHQSTHLYVEHLMKMEQQGAAAEAASRQSTQDAAEEAQGREQSAGIASQAAEQAARLAPKPAGSGRARA